MTRKIARTWNAVIVLSLLVAGCSSTSDRQDASDRIERSAGRRAGGSVEREAEGEPSQGEAPSGGPRGGSATTTAAPPAARGRRGPSAPPASAPAAPRQVPGLGGPGPGVTAGKIKIGFWIVDVSGACSSLGIEGTPACSGSNEAEFKAINDWINANGGIARRKLEPVVIKSDIERSGYSAAAQAACESFAEDHKVFAVIVAPQFSRPEFVNCLAKRRTPVVDGGFWPFDSRDRQGLGGVLYQPNRPAPERWVAALIEGLAAQGFFDRGARVGLLRFDGGPFRRVTDGVLKPRLAAHGVRLTEEFAITPPQNTTSGYGAMNAQLNSAVLRFRNSRVNRVIFFGTLLETQFFFLNSAEAQGYRPRYGLNSLDFPSFLEEMAPRAQLQGAIGIGWSIVYDVAPERDPGANAASSRCKKILQDAGVDAGAGRNAKCDSAFFLKAALDRAPALNAQGLRLAVEKLGTSFQPAETFATQFGPGRYDGPSRYRYVRFEQGCGCFRYTGGLRPFP